jgi:hypothetical protein
MQDLTRWFMEKFLPLSILYKKNQTLVNLRKGEYNKMIQEGLSATPAPKYAGGIDDEKMDKALRRAALRGGFPVGGGVFRADSGHVGRL